MCKFRGLISGAVIGFVRVRHGASQLGVVVGRVACCVSCLEVHVGL